MATRAQRRNAKGWHPPQKGKKEGTTGNTFLKILLKFLKNLTKLPAGTEKAWSSFKSRNHMAKMFRKFSLDTEYRLKGRKRRRHQLSEDLAIAKQK